MFKRILNFKDLRQKSCFLWGARQVGKTTLLQQCFPEAQFFNLLDPRLFERFTRDPGLLKDELLEKLSQKFPVVIDEIQKVPQLLDVVQLLIDQNKMQFILSGSSARKLKRGGANLLGGRALRYELFPLTSEEIPDFDLKRALNHGLLPQHYLNPSPKDLIHAYVGDYLKEEVFAEALTRNLQAFSQFLEAAAFSNGELINYTNIASECGVYSSTIKDYFQILIDTLVGHYLFVFQKRPKRRIKKAPKFYFFDLGIPNFLLKRISIEPGSEVFGKVLEHFIFQEILAYSYYSRLHYPMAFWHTSSDIEVDFILGDHEVAVEVKATKTAQPKHLKGLIAFAEEYKVKKSFLVSLDPHPRLIKNIHLLPWKIFLKKLWQGEII